MRGKITIQIVLLWTLLNVVSSIDGQVDFVPYKSDNTLGQGQLSKYKYEMMNRVRNQGRFKTDRLADPITFYYVYPPTFLQPTKVEANKNQYYVVANNNKQEGDKAVKTVKSAPDLKSSNRNRDVAMKMKALESVLNDDEKGSGESETLHTLHEQMKRSPYMTNEIKRIARQVKKQRPGFFWTLIRVTFETINDTRLAIQQIAKYLNESIAPDQSNRTGKKQKKPTNSDSVKAETKNENGNSTTTTSTTPAPTSTTEGSLISRSSLVKLIARNVKGLIRLFNIEWSDAWKQSQKSVNEFRSNLGKQVFSYLQDNPDFY